MNMKKLLNNFSGRASQSGWSFQLIEREDHKAIYSKTDGINTYFEAIRIRVVGDSVVGGNVIVGGERYPNDSAFGTDGFCCSTLEKAKYFYDSIPNLDTNEG